jgi:ubiquinone/menaquinone biosynthesis C-methylase UbiE
MNAIVERYDSSAFDYARYWGPVLEATSRRLLDEVAPIAARDQAARVVDVGSGTGALAIAAVDRWPLAEIVASDAAEGMLNVARARAVEAGLDSGSRLKFIVGAADGLPLPDASADVVISSFVFQLVPDRSAALREALRILRPGGRLAYVTWLDRDSGGPFRPAEEFDEAVLDLAIDELDLDEEPHAGDVPSPKAAVKELRGAGFVAAKAREDELVYDWTAEAYLEYKLAYDERALMSILDADQQRRLEEGARRRLATLPAADFRWHAPIVFARGMRPG